MSEEEFYLRRDLFLNELDKQNIDYIYEDYIQKEKEYKEEIERLNNKVEELMELYTTERHCKDDYKYIINELEKWLEEQHQFIIEIPAYTKEISIEHKTMEICYENVLDKLQELKGVDKE